jgi:murein DD-endopeptidase MepM/ murein hydrolase activator NlpD
MEGTSTKSRTIIGGPSLPKAKRTQAYTASLQRDLNRHLIALGSPTVLAVDGDFGTETEQAFKRVCKVLGVEPAKSVRTYRVIAGAAAPRSEQELQKAATDGAAYAEQLRKRFANEPQIDDAPAARLRAAGARFEDAILREAARSGLPVPLICAVLEIETGFQNVFGHDNVRNPVKSPPGGLLTVTEARYQDYLRHRRAGLGNQGVGPMQLTSPGLQDRADALGGCWTPDANIRTGVEFLAANIQRLGLRRGVIAYNGAAIYADKVFAAEARWRAKLGDADSGPRTLAVPMQGNDVLALQQLINHRLQAWGIAIRVAEDGDLGTETFTAAKNVAYGLGLTVPGSGITPALRIKLRHPSRRTRDELARARVRRAWRERLRTPYPLAVHGPIIGTPYHGTHTRGNWQSDNALDIAVPEGTAVLALADGVIEKTYNSPSGVTAGWQVTLRAVDNAWFYGHLKTVRVQAGQRVLRGQTIGTSGSANGVAHLHLGQQTGTPHFQ